MKLRVTVNGVAYEVDVDILEDREGAFAPSRPFASLVTPPRPPAPAPPMPAAPAVGGKTLASPIPGTVVEVMVQPGAQVTFGQPVIVIDAMKMNTQVTANMDGVIKEVLVKAGEPVKMGQALLTFE